MDNSATHSSGESFEPSRIPVVILCGGKGTRLKEETEVIPKPLIKIGEFPVVWHVMKIYYAQGFRKFILLTGYKGEKIKEYFYSYPMRHSDFTVRRGAQGDEITYHARPSEDWEVTLVDTGVETEKGGRLKKAAHFIGDTPFMLTYSDGVTNLNLAELVRFHRAHGLLATVSAVRPPGRFGEIAVEGDLVRSFEEKPSRQQGLINAGFFMMEPKVLQSLSDDPMLDLEKDVLPALARESALAVYRHEGYWQCMDTLRDVELLNDTWKRGNAPWKLWNE